jgi:hypothetical protein
MSLFRQLFKKVSKRTLQDPAFGSIEFDPSHGMDMWCHIPTESGDHMIVIDAPITGPTQIQQDFYSSLKANLPMRLLESKTFIATQDEVPANLSEMTIYSVAIGPESDLSAGRFTIEISDSEANQIHRVEFNSGKPELYGIDD